MLRRFISLDMIRSTPGVGLGLSLVAAIVKTAFQLTIVPGPGCVVEDCLPAPAAGRVKRRCRALGGS